MTQSTGKYVQSVLVAVTALAWIAVDAVAQPSPHNRPAAPARQVSFTNPEIPSGPAVRYTAGSVFDGSCASGNCGGSPVFDDGGMVYDEGSVMPGGTYDGFCDEGCGPRFSLGVDFTFLKPHFENNVAFTTLDSDGATTETFTDSEFNYDTELAPRVWLEMLQCGNMGLRASWWQFDNAAAVASGSPPANGFGRISTPMFGSVDLSTTVPNSTYTARSNLKANNVDLEGTTAFNCGDWGWMATAGLRYATMEQTYNSSLTNQANATQGTINYFHELRGIGPTVSARTQRPLTGQLSLFGLARGSLLFGDSTSQLNAVEDQDLDAQLTTVQSTSRDDLLPVGDVQVGLQWTPVSYGVWNPYLHVALEGQFWGGAGNASSETGNLGFYGFNFALGMDW